MDPCEIPSTNTLCIANPPLGVMLYVVFDPQFTIEVPEGVTEPLAPELAVIAKVTGVKLAVIV